MLSQGKILADQFDKDSKFSDVPAKEKKTKSSKKSKSKDEKKEKKQAKKEEPPKPIETPKDDTQKLADELQADPGVTTE